MKKIKSASSIQPNRVVFFFILMYIVTDMVMKQDSNVDITFQTQKLKKIFNSHTKLTKTYNARMARIIAIRLTVLKNAQTLTMVPTIPPLRRHQLKGKRKGQYAIDLVHPYRLIFRPANDPIPYRQDGGIDTDRVTVITILEVVDYH